MELIGLQCCFELLNVERAFNRSLGKPSILTALIYSPLNVLVSRIQTSSQSTGELPLLQLSKIFQQKTSDEEVILFSITREQAEKAFTVLFQEWAQTTHTSYSSEEKTID